MPQPPLSSADTQALDLVSVARASLATRVLFILFGFATAAWAPLVPFLKARMALDDRTLGMFIPCISIGSIFMMPLGPFLMARFGCRRMMVIGGVLLLLAYIPIATVSSVWLLAPVLLLYGLTTGLLNIGLNVHGVFLQKQTGRSLISSFHGCYSVGSIGGAVAVATLLGMGLAPLTAVLWMALALLPLLLVGGPRFLVSLGEPSSAPRFIRPRGVVWLLSLFCMVQFMSEGAVGDWSALFLSQQRGVAASHAGWGFAAFATAMACGRLFGDRFVHSLGTVRVLVWGTGLGALSYLLIAWLPWDWAALAGFGLFGLVVSNIAPVLFTMAGRQNDMPLGDALASINTFGYIGCISGPLIIGMVAQSSSLSVSYCFLALALCAVAFTAYRKFGRPGAF